MPVTCQYVDHKQGVIITASGNVDGEEFINKIAELFTDEKTIQNYKFGLVDLTQLEKFDISLTQIANLANLHIEASKNNRNIIVGFAINKRFVHGLVRVWMSYASITGWQSNIEKTVPEIKDWIDNEF